MKPPCSATCGTPPAAAPQRLGAAQRLRCLAAGGDRGSNSSSAGSRGASSNKGGGGGKPRGGGGSKPRGGGGGKQQQGGGKQQQARAARAAPQNECLVPPLRSQVVGELAVSERMPPPIWGTFCGVSNGLWCGITEAYSPFTGQPEPLSLDAQRKPITLLQQCCVEQRVAGDDDSDCVVRHVARAETQEGLHREMAQGGALHFPACGLPSDAGGVAECWDEERFASGQPGLVVFDGGGYSLGPPTIGSPAELPLQVQLAFDDEAAAAAAAALEAALAAAPAPDSIELLAEEEVEGKGEAEGPMPDVAALAASEVAELDWTAAVIEHCMQWGGEQRLRIKITLDTAGGGDGTDLEIQPLRVAVSREAWEGLPGSFVPKAQGSGAAEQQQASRQVRLDAAALGGSWKVFEVTAVTVDDVSLQTGLPTQATLYTAHETLRTLDSALPEDGGDGALLLLPHACGVQLETLRLDNQRRRGLRVATHWCPQPGMLLTTARLYDADGRLLEVGTATAIRDE